MIGKTIDTVMLTFYDDNLICQNFPTQALKNVSFNFVAVHKSCFYHFTRWIVLFCAPLYTKANIPSKRRHR